MELEDKEIMEHILELQEQLHRAIDSRQLQDCRRFISDLSKCEILDHFPNSLDFYASQHQHSTPLLHAIAKGHVDVALLLLDSGVDPFLDSTPPKFPTIKSSDAKLSKVLFRVIEKPGFEKVLKKILDRMEKMVVDKNSDTVLHIIAKKKILPMLEVVLCSDWLSEMLKHFNNQGYLPLHIAASSNFLQFFQIFFQYRCPSQVLNSGSKLCLCQHKDPLSLTDGCDLRTHIMKACENLSLNASVKLSKVTALHLCARGRSWKLVETLTELGADVNASDETGKTPLVECLDEKGRKQLSDSTQCDLLKVCKILLQRGANVNVRSNIRYSERRSMANDDSVTPLHLAAGIGANDVVKLLLNNGADTKQLSGDIGKIPVQFALEHGHSEAALTLVSPELYPERFLATHVDYAFNSLLHSADKCSSEVCSKLISLSCPLDRPNVNHLRPLDKAISSRNMPCVELILDAQPSIVNVHLHQDPTAYPPLHLAASSGNINVCQILLSCGADIYSRAYGKHMAYRKALKFNRFETAVFLCEQMSKPFPSAEREELLSHIQTFEPDLARRLLHRLDEIPSLVTTSLDAIRKIFIKKQFSFKDVHTLPVPEAVIKAIKYQNTGYEMDKACRPL